MFKARHPGDGFERQILLLQQGFYPVQPPAADLLEQGSPGHVLEAAEQDAAGNLQPPREFVGQVGSVMGMDVIQSRRRLLRHMRAGDAGKAVAEMEKHLKVLHAHYRDVAAKINATPKRKKSNAAK